jgi:hypothetical protein
VTYPTDGTFSQHILDKARIKMQQRVGASVLESMRMSMDELVGMVGHELALNLEAYVLSEKLPPQRVQHRVEAVHPEAGGMDGYADDPRWATWRDHFWASHRRLARLFRRMPHTIMTPVRYRVAVPVKCRHDVTLNIEDVWTYPMSDTVLPGYGHAVLKSAPSLLGPISRAVSPYDEQG